MTGWVAQCRQMARALAVHALVASLVLAAGVAVLLPIVQAGLAGVVAVTALLLALPALALAGHVAFDAVLFAMMSRRPDEAAACATVDALLARLRLVSPRATPRPLAPRIAGSRRLLARLRVLLFGFAAVTGVAALVSCATRMEG